MGTLLISNTTLSTIAKFILDDYNHNVHLRSSFGLPQYSISSFVREANQIMLQLQELNVKSYNQAYPYDARTLEPLPYTPVERKSIAQVLKRIDALLYNIDDPFDKEPIVLAIKEYRESLVIRLLDSLDDYKNEEWC